VKVLVDGCVWGGAADDLAAAAIMRYADELRRGAIVTVEPGRTRVRLREQDDASDDPQQ